MAALSDLPDLTVYCTRGDCEAILSIGGVALRLDDNQDDSESAVEESYVDFFIQRATARVNLYLMGRYSATQLALSYAANDFTAIIAAYRLCQRRGNPVPQSIAEAYKETIELLTDIKSNKMALEDVPERTSSSISWRNIHHSRHMVKRNRVQRTISERTTPGDGTSAMAVDRPAEYYGSELYWL